MKLKISAEDEGKQIMSATLVFPDRDEGLGVAHMLEAFARNRWQTSQDEKHQKSINEKYDPEDPIQVA
jgi:hypothetical protein